MSRIVEQMAASGQLDADAVARVGKNVAEFVKLARANPSFHKDALVKLAAPIPGWQQAGTAMAIGAGMQLAMSAAGDIYGSIKGSIDKGRNYKKMLDDNPDLGKQQVATQVQKAFSTLHKFNPQYASDPTVAGEFVRNTLDMERVDLNQVNALTQARKNIVDATRRTPSRAKDTMDYGTAFMPTRAPSATD